MTMIRRWEMTGFGRGTLQLRRVPMPELQPGHVLVKAAAVALNFRDKLVIEHGIGLTPVT